MKNNFFQYCIKVLKVLIWPIIFLIGQFIINYLFASVYSLFHPDLSLVELTNNTISFMNSHQIIITLANFIILMTIFLTVYKRLQNDNYKIYKDYIYLFLFGIGYSIVINILFLNISNTFNISIDQFSGLDATKFVSTIICSGLLGPIMEEYLFRGIIYNKLKAFNSEKISMFLTALIFSLLHGNIFNIINAFLLNYILIFVYRKYHTLLAPIILHITVNTTVVFIINIIITQAIYLNYFLFIISFIIIMISSVKVFSKE
ncbi:MAG: CPBP family intramembrane glutamic endopeptidase [Bacilli bacterium]